MLETAQFNDITLEWQSSAAVIRMLGNKTNMLPSGTLGITGQVQIIAVKIMT